MKRRVETTRANRQIASANRVGESRRRIRIVLDVRDGVDGGGEMWDERRGERVEELQRMTRRDVR